MLLSPALDSDIFAHVAVNPVVGYRTFGQLYTDLVTWGAIGARTVESQVHRQLASGLSMPVGIKNRTDGDIQVAADALLFARHSHLFPSLTKEGAPAIFETTVNQFCHLILRGGSKSGPNYERERIVAAKRALNHAGLWFPARIEFTYEHVGK